MWRMYVGGGVGGIELEDEAFDEPLKIKTSSALHEFAENLDNILNQLSLSVSWKCIRGTPGFQG